MGNTKPWLVEVRLFKLRPGTRAEFDRISRDGTIPLMRKMGIKVIAHGPSLNNENGYFLMRAFPSEPERVEQSQAFYTTPGWAKYEDSITGMVEDYETAVLPAPAEWLPFTGKP